MVFPIMLWWQRNHWADHIQRWCFTLVLWPGTDWMSLDPYVLNCCFCFFYYFLYFFSFRLVPFFRNCHIKSSFSSYKRNIYIFSSNVLTLYHSIISFFLSLLLSCHFLVFHVFIIIIMCPHFYSRCSGVTFCSTKADEKTLTRLRRGWSLVTEVLHCSKHIYIYYHLVEGRQHGWKVLVWAAD